MTDTTWATVTQLSPLRIRVDGDAAALVLTPESLVDPAALAVDARVRVELYDRRILIIGMSGGEERASSAEAIAGNDAARAITPATLAAALAELLGRNLLFNARFRINQRGAASGTSLGSGTYFLDRWKSGTSSNAITWTGSDVAGRVLTVPASKSLIQDVERADVLADDYVLVNYGTAQGRVYNVGGSTPSYAAATPTSPLLVALDGTADVRVQFGPGTVDRPVLMRASEYVGLFPDVPIADDLARCRRYFQAFAASEVLVENIYFNVALGGGGQHLSLAMMPMRAAPTVRRSDGTTGVHSFTYYPASASGGNVSRNITITSTTPLSILANYGSGDNGGSLLASGYARGANNNPIWLDAEL